MKLTPTIERIPESAQIALTLSLSLSIMWGFGLFIYKLPAEFLLIPSVFLTAVVGPLALILEWARRRQKKLKAEMAGKCPHCSYDLRAHQPGDKCPECGTPIATSADSKTGYNV
jgi:hypothetical protein